MEMVVYGSRFERGKWRNWEHTCSLKEIDAVDDSARAKSVDHGRPGQPTHADYLAGAHYMFDVAKGPREKPAEGDIWVYGLRIDQIVIGLFEALERHFARR